MEKKTERWWDKFGKPEYGGTLTVRLQDIDNISCDPCNQFGAQHAYFYEGLASFNPIIDRKIFPYQMGFTPEQYLKGVLIEGWESTDSTTITVRVRKGIKWHKKPPVNGRELSAYDIKYSYDRILGTGSGFGQPDPNWRGMANTIEKIIVTDNHTVQFHLKQPGFTVLYEILEGPIHPGQVPIIAREWVEQGDLENWENAVGTGPWMLTDYVPGRSLTFNRNPDYYYSDDRYEQNRLPYIDTLKMVAMKDMDKAVESLKNGEIDMILDPRGGLTLQHGAGLAKTNPEIRQATLASSGHELSLRCDMEPFNDIKVRKALQMSIDRKAIAKNHYLGTVDGIPCGLASPLYKEWITPYEKWQKKLRDEYSYNPEKARLFLKGAGYPDGFKTNCLANTKDDIDLLNIIKGYFADIGVDMDIKVVDFFDFRDIVQKGQYDQMVFSGNMALPFRPDIIINMRHSANGLNYTHNNDPEYDDMVNSFKTAITQEQSQKLLNEADQYALRKHWAVNICPTVAPVAWQPWVKGYVGELVMRASQPGNYFAHFWIDQSLKKH